ncbi:MAG: hypothetical protein GXP19_02910 [Gammaproteobacteria bacterium]|nr:hypothetical protein [Gammaproteobacteria bacterium]
MSISNKIAIIFFSLYSINICLADNQTPQEQQNKFTLIYSGNLNGELEPCGCAEETDLGGIKRRASMIQTLRKENPAMFLITSGGLITSESPRDKLKSQYILKGIATMNYDAIGVQWRDLAYGEEFLKNDTLTTLPWVASNWHNDNFDKQLFIMRNNIKLAFFNWLDPKNSPQQQMQGKHQSVSDNINTLTELIKKAKDNNAVTVLSTTLSLKKALKQIPLDHIDVLLIRSAHEVYSEPQLHKSTLVLQPGSRGMRLGRVDIKLNKKNKIDKFKQEVIRLPDSIADAAYLTQWYDQYNAKVKEDYLKRVAIRKKLETGESQFAGENICKTCHAKEHKIWQASKHASAFEELEAVNKAFDPDCIVCHTVGFEKTGGFIDSTVTANLLNVQCESCHGASREHANSGGKTKVSNHGWPKEKVCAQCHVGSHSPSFKVDSYWPKIIHGKASSQKASN